MNRLLVLSVGFAVLCLGVASLDVNAHYQERAAASRIAFSAGLTKNADLHTNDSVVFDKVYTNVGNGYNPANGQFTCPAPGTYVFQFHGVTENDGEIWLELYKNQQYIISAYSHSTNDFGAASNAVVLNLNAGDTVHLIGDGDVALFGDPAKIYATFSGFLLYAAGN